MNAGAVESVELLDDELEGAEGSAAGAEPDRSIGEKVCEESDGSVAFVGVVELLLGVSG